MFSGNSKLAEMKRQHAEEIEQLGTQLAQQKQTIVDMQLRVDNRNKSIKLKDATIKQLADQVTELEAGVDELLETRANLELAGKRKDTEISQLKQHVINAKQDINRLKTVVANKAIKAGKARKAVS